MADLEDEIMKIRRDWKRSDDARDAGLPLEIPGVRRINDISYGPDPKWNLLDLYLPENVEGRIPVIINVHGGGYCYGTKETYQFYGLNLAAHGFAFVNPNYRLAPDVVFPGELDDVDRYVHWVSDHADEYGLDRNNVFITGDSAGGQMAEQYITILTNPAYRSLFPYRPVQLKFRACALNSGAFFLFDSGMIGGVLEAYFPKDVVEENRQLLSVENYITEDFLPCYLSTANEDFIHDQTIKLDGFLTARGVEHVCRSFGDRDNPQPHVFLMNQKDETARKCNDEEIEFFRRHMA
ncbi:alpha/beta hydrolase [Ligilactobacillus sp.]|uniref:alpha/beta hydrolase n=1 Tax=Ligilactobacillus sp. TaxID=2767921 RepID=UPI002FE2B4A6